MNIHEGIRPYPCRFPACEVRFFQSGQRVIHERKSHPRFAATRGMNTAGQRGLGARPRAGRRARPRADTTPDQEQAEDDQGQDNSHVSAALRENDSGMNSEERHGEDYVSSDASDEDVKKNDGDL